MGHVYEIAHSNDFIIKDLNKFKEGLEGFNGECGKFEFTYSDYKRKSKNAQINVSSTHFDRWLENKDGLEINIIEYIQQHIKDGEECIIHLVSYEQPINMSITKYVINNSHKEEIVIID